MTCTPRRASVFSAFADDFGWNGLSTRGAASTSVIGRPSSSRSVKSLLSTRSTSSRSPPAVSTPVGPPPTTTIARSGRGRPAATSLPACSNVASRRVRKRIASCSVLSGIACSSTPAMPKLVDTDPAAIDEVVVVEIAARRSMATVRRSRSIGGDSAEHEPCRLRAAQDAPHREADVAGIEPCRRNLVQQRLERVEVVGVDRPSRRRAHRATP